MNYTEVYRLITTEHDFMNKKWGRSASSQWRDSKEVKLRILAEEFGEVAKAINEYDNDNLMEELVQVAALSISWLLSDFDFKEGYRENE